MSQATVLHSPWPLPQPTCQTPVGRPSECGGRIWWRRLHTAAPVGESKPCLLEIADICNTDLGAGKGKYLVLFKRGDVMCVGVGQSSDDDFGVIAEIISYQYLCHEGRDMDTQVCRHSELSPVPSPPLQEPK